MQVPLPQAVTAPQSDAIGRGEMVRGIIAVVAAVVVLGAVLLLALNAAGFFACGCTSPAAGWSSPPG